MTTQAMCLSSQVLPSARSSPADSSQALSRPTGCKSHPHKVPLTHARLASVKRPRSEDGVLERPQKTRRLSAPSISPADSLTVHAQYPTVDERLTQPPIPSCTKFWISENSHLPSPDRSFQQQRKASSCQCAPTTPAFSTTIYSNHNCGQVQGGNSTAKYRKPSLLPSPSPSTGTSTDREIYPTARASIDEDVHKPGLEPQTWQQDLREDFDFPLSPSDRKRTRSDEEEEPSQHHYKRPRLHATFGPVELVDPQIARGCEEEDLNCEPVAYWTRTSWWPPGVAGMSQERSVSPKKRQMSFSYTQRFKDGEVPQQYSREYEKYLAECGIYMDEPPGQSQIQVDSQQVYRSLLGETYPEPLYTTFPLSQFMLMWQRARNRNESRVYRDITPLLVPSPELLWMTGEQELEHVVEEVNAEWTKCKPLAGPTPKPDLAVGVGHTAFDEEELAKLKNYTAFERPTLFTGDMYLPFLLCEVKCGDQGINKADRQNMHSGSMAVDAVVRLCRSVDTAAALSGQILVFSVSHDNERVKLYGHYAIIKHGKSTFYRHPIKSFELNFEEDQGRKKTYDFVRAIYHTFYPTHLKRIRDTLALMVDPREVPVLSTMSITETESQGNLEQEREQGQGSSERDQTTSVLSSQETTSFKKPGEPASKKRKGELAILREQLVEQQRQSKEQMTLFEKQIAEQQSQNKDLSAQLGQQRKESVQQLQELTKAMTEQSAQIRDLLRK